MKNANKIIDRIKKEQIKSTPRWIFLTKKTFIWLFFLFAVVFGALAFSVILLAVQQTDFSITSHLSHSRLELFLGLLPIIWLILVFFFLGLSIASIRSSWKGYKFSIFRLVSICLLMSVSLGTLFFIAGGSHRLEQAFNVNIFSYESIEERKMEIWNNPEEGYLAGKIKRVDDQQIELEDFDNQTWQVSYQDAFIAPIVMLETAETIKIIGEMVGENQFIGKEIRPWGGPASRRMGTHRGRQDPER